MVAPTPVPPHTYYQPEIPAFRLWASSFFFYILYTHNENLWRRGGRLLLLLVCSIPFAHVTRSRWATRDKVPCGFRTYTCFFRACEFCVCVCMRIVCVFVEWAMRTGWAKGMFKLAGCFAVFVYIFLYSGRVRGVGGSPSICLAFLRALDFTRGYYFFFFVFYIEIERRWEIFLRFFRGPRGACSDGYMP